MLYLIALRYSIHFDFIVYIILILKWILQLLYNYVINITVLYNYVIGITAFI